MEPVPAKKSGFAQLKEAPSSLLFHHRFTDIDELAAMLPDDTILTQLSLQPLQCDSTALVFEGLLGFYFNQPNCSIKAIGRKPAGFFTFVCDLYGQGQPMLSHDLSMTENYLFGFSWDRGVDILVSGGITHCVVYVQRDMLVTCAEVMDRPDLNRLYFAPNYVFAPETLPPLRAYLQQLYGLIQQRSPLLQQRNFQELIVQDFLPLLITALPLHQDSLKNFPRSFQRSRLVKQAETYMQENLAYPLTLTTLCEALNTSSRSLSYGFQEIFGVSPMAYLKVLRLQAVYRALKTSTTSNKTISSIASEFGFWSMGHFSRDYKQMFGELPSATFTQTSNF